MTVTADQIAKVKATTPNFTNVQWIADACSRTKCRFYIAIAMFDKESDGHNIYGGDAGGALRGYKGPVDAGSYRVFRWMIDEGVPIRQSGGSHKIVKFGPNGVGPGQVTHPDLVAEMKARDLDIRNVEDNIYFCTERIYKFYRYARDVQKKSVDDALWYAGKRYNGGDAYATDFVKVARSWLEKVGNADYT